MTANPSLRIVIVKGKQSGLWYPLLVDDDGPVRTSAGSSKYLEAAVEMGRTWAEQEGYRFAEREHYERPYGRNQNSAPSGSGQSEKEDQ